MQFKSTSKRIENIPTKMWHKIYPQKPSLGEKKPSSQKHPSPCIIQKKAPLQHNHGSLQIHSHNQEIHVNNHKSTHPITFFQPSQMLPWLTYQALSSLNLSLFAFFLISKTTLMVSYIVASPTKPPSGNT